ncbi:MAG: methionyl-tRNA formyltransferase [Bacilli bacterium]|nr:methionyl-tRNA formyltransferase [Bacilli bacterium]
MKDLKVVFMGTPDFSVPVLQGLIDTCNVIGVVTQPDKEVGRKKEIEFSPIKKLAIANNIKVLQPEKIRTDFQCVLDLNPDIIITCAYGQIIPVEILEYPKYKCINVHASLLPKYRGGAPIHRAIINGEKETGITIMYMAPGMDDGDIISQEKISIGENETVGELHDKLSIMGKELLLKTLPSIIDGTNERIKQDETKVSLAKIIKKEDEVIDFNDSAINVHNKIRGLSPFPGGYALLEDKRVKFYKSKVEKTNIAALPGTIVKVDKTGMYVKTNDELVVIEELKIEGKKRLTIQDLLNGMNKEELLNKIFRKE